MSLVDDFIQTHAVELVGRLVHAGFSNGQAQHFLLESPQRVLQLLRPGSGVPAGQDIGELSLLLEEIDVAALAELTDIDSLLVTSGLVAVIPRLLKFARGRIPAGWPEDFHTLPH